jgi:DNA-directed RNA polymerase specialized sigma24 family protein
VNSKQVRAFEGFVAESGDALLRMATLLTSDPDAAEDLYQETLQRLADRAHHRYRRVPVDHRQQHRAARPVPQLKTPRPADRG